MQMPHSWNVLGMNKEQSGGQSGWKEGEEWVRWGGQGE